MRAMILEGGRSLHRATVADPTPGAGEAVVKVHACSICGSDVHAYHGKHPRLTFPRILGHEFAGEIVALGSGMEGFKVGERVACDVDFPCGACGPCREGRGNICEKLRTMGFDRDGAYAEYAAVPSFNLHRLPESVTFDQASTVQVLGISYHAVADRVRLKPGERVAVIGAGPIGLGAGLISQLFGAEVTIYDILDYRRSKAKELGIPNALDPRAGDVREGALALTQGRGFDRVIECVGGFQEQTVKDAVAIVKRGGQITVVGTFPENKATIPIAYIKDREIDLNFSRGNFRAFPPCIELIASRKIDPEIYISHRFALGRAEEALQVLEQREVEAHKVVLHPQEA